MVINVQNLCGQEVLVVIIVINAINVINVINAINIINAINAINVPVKYRSPQGLFHFRGQYRFGVLDYTILSKNSVVAHSVIMMCDLRPPRLIVVFVQDLCA